MERVWTFRTGRFLVALDIEPEQGYQYDGDDPRGKVQRKLDAGEYIAFDARLRVYFRGTPIGEDTLGGSVYDARDIKPFWQAHRTSPPQYRNTLAQKEAGRVIGHYFPDMVREAVQEAREFVKELCPSRGT